MQVRAAIRRLFAREQLRDCRGRPLRDVERRDNAHAVARVAARAVEAVRRHLHGVVRQIRAVRPVVDDLRYALAVAALADDDARSRAEDTAGKDLRRARAAPVHQNDHRLVRQVRARIALGDGITVAVDKIGKLSLARKGAERRHRRGGKAASVAAQIHDPRMHRAVIFAHAVLKIRSRLRAEAAAVDIADAAFRADACIRLHDERARHGEVLFAAVRAQDRHAHLCARLAEQLFACLGRSRHAALSIDGNDHVAREQSRFLRAAALERRHDLDARFAVSDLRADADEALLALNACEEGLVFLARHVVGIVIRVGKELVERFGLLRRIRELVNVAALQDLARFLHAQRLRARCKKQRRSAGKRAETQTFMFHGVSPLFLSVPSLYRGGRKKQMKIPASPALQGAAK